MIALLGAVALIVGGAVIVARLLSAETDIAELAQETHFHGLAVDPADPDRFYLATHNGLFVVGPDGTARLVSKTRDDFMGFTVHPTQSSIFYASGHPATGGNLGILASSDSGRSWSKLANGSAGLADFHQMDVSKSNPDVIYGIHDGIHKSPDGGRSWGRIALQPKDLNDVAIGRDPDTLYAATQDGLLKSSDGGRSWQPAYFLPRPASMVHVTNAGEVFAFVAGTGLIRAREQNLDWKVVSNDFGGSYVLHLATSSTDPQRLYVVTVDPEIRAQAILTSGDGGSSWAVFGTEGA